MLGCGNPRLTRSGSYLPYFNTNNGRSRTHPSLQTMLYGISKTSSSHNTTPHRRYIISSSHCSSRPIWERRAGYRRTSAICLSFASCPPHRPTR